MRASETPRLDRFRGPLALLYLSLGPIVWALHFTIVYGAHTLACAVGASAGTAALIVIIATVGALILLAAAMVVVMRQRISTGRAPWASFAHRTMALLALLSATGVIWAGAASLIVDACTSLR